MKKLYKRYAPILLGSVLGFCYSVGVLGVAPVVAAPAALLTFAVMSVAYHVFVFREP